MGIASPVYAHAGAAPWGWELETLQVGSSHLPRLTRLQNLAYTSTWKVFVFCGVATRTGFQRLDSKPP